MKIVDRLDSPDKDLDACTVTADGSFYFVSFVEEMADKHNDGRLVAEVEQGSDTAHH